MPDTSSISLCQLICKYRLFRRHVVHLHLQAAHSQDRCLQQNHLFSTAALTLESCRSQAAGYATAARKCSLLQT